MERKLKLGFVLAAGMAVTAPPVVPRALAQLRTDATIPTTRVKRADLDLRVYTTGDLRPGRTSMLVAPPVAGGTLRIVHLAKAGTRVKSGEVVIEFDSSEQEYNLAQSNSEVMQAEQEITKAKADAAVQGAQDEAALVKARFDVRRAELDVSGNELVSAIDAKKNLLKLDEANRALAQLQEDIKSHKASNQATIAVDEEKRNKARLAMEQARKNIENMRVRSPMNGLVEVKQNTDASGGMFFGGMTLPSYREGDQVNPGAFVASVLDTEQMEIQSKVNESDRANLKPGQPAAVRVDALPGESFNGKIKTVAGMASNDMWGGDSSSKFDATFQLDKFDPRLRPGFTAHLIIMGNPVKNALCLPRQAIFEKEGKPVVYVKSGQKFEPHEVKVKFRNEGRVAVEGLNEGAEVALVNPEKAGKKTQQVSGPLNPSISGGSQ